jgi:hypothetical protein
MAEDTPEEVQIFDAGFSLSWTTNYPSLLASAQGTMLTRAGYESQRQTRTCLYPWQIPDRAQTVGPKGAPIASDRIDSFWFRYLRSQPNLYWGLDQDTAWDLVIPLWKTEHQFTVSLPGHSSVTAAKLEVLLYPTATTVIFRAEVSGVWSLDALVEQIASMRRSARWNVTGALTSQGGLDAIASEINGQVAVILADALPSRLNAPIVQTVAALFHFDGYLRADDEGVGRNLEGLSALKRADTVKGSGRREENRLESHAARMYIGENGHTIWSPDPPVRHLTYLLRSHAELVAHIAALSGIVAWARDQINSNIPIPVAVQPLVVRAARCLKGLHEGNPQTTYRAGIARERIQPLISAIDLIGAAL